MLRRVRTIQWVGLAIMAASAFWPTLHFRSYPIPGVAVPEARAAHRSADPPTTDRGYFMPGAREVPARELATALGETARGPSRVRPLWERRRWYPYFLLPCWILAFVLLAGTSRERGGFRRRIVGTSLWTLALVLAVFEAVYLRAEYAPFLPGFAGRAEAFLAWLLVVAILLYRRRADRALGAVEATVAAQALLSFVHALTLPSTMARGWWGNYETAAVLETVWVNFPPAFWLGCVGLLLIALPVYLRRS